MTLHITLRIEPLRWFDLAIAALRRTAERTPALRETLPPGFLHDSAMCSISKDRLHGLFGSSVHDPDISEGLTELGKQLTRQLMPILDNRFETLGTLDSLGQESVLGKRAGTVSFLEIANGNLNLHYGGNFFAAPLRIRPALEFIMANETFTVAAIPGLDAPSRIVLASRLLKAGYLAFRP